MIILAIDPGTRESGVVRLDSAAYQPMTGDYSGASWAGSAPPWGAIMPNRELLEMLRRENLHPPGEKAHVYVCEMKQYYGKDSHAGSETFESCVWIGRFMEAIEMLIEGRELQRITRPVIRAQVCGTTRSSDKEVRQALIDRFGGDSVALKGKKCPAKPRNGGYAASGSPIHAGCPKCDGSGWLRKPGPLAGITSHMWSALAVAVTWAETHKEEP